MTVETHYYSVSVSSLSHSSFHSMLCNHGRTLIGPGICIACYDWAYVHAMCLLLLREAHACTSFSNKDSVLVIVFGLYRRFGSAAAMFRYQRTFVYTATGSDAGHVPLWDLIVFFKGFLMQYRSSLCDAVSFQSSLANTYNRALAWHVSHFQKITASSTKLVQRWTTHLNVGHNWRFILCKTTKNSETHSYRNYR